MSLEDKIIAYKALTQEIDKLEEQKRTLAQEILAEMPEKKIDVAGYRVYRYTRLSIAVPLEEARLLGATQMTEQVDKEKIKELHGKGHQIEGVKEVTYLQVRNAVSIDPITKSS